MKPFLSVYGHVAIDQIFRVADFPKDNTSIDVLDKTTVLGGTGTNVAIHAANMGVPTALCAFVGSDFPSKFREYIESKNVITDELIEVDGYDTSQASVINNKAMVQKVLFYQGPQGFASKLGIEMTTNASVSDYVHFCTGEPIFYEKCMKKIDGKIALDPAQEVHRIWDAETFNRILAHSDFLFGNEFEFDSMLKYAKAKSLKDFDASLVVRTLGEKGSEAIIDGEHFSIPVIKAKKFVDMTGAGDSYRAGFYAGLYNKYDIHESLVIGASLSSFVVEEVGALTANPTWDDVLDRAEPYLRKV